MEAARELCIQIAKCTDRRARTMGHVGSEYGFLFEILSIVFILVFLSCSSQ